MSEQAVEGVERTQVPTEVSTSGPVTNAQRAAIETMVEKVVGSVDDRVVHVRIRAEQHPEQSKARPVMVRVVLDIKGGPVRAHVSASSVHEAIDAVEHRLRAQLRARAERRQTAQHRGPASGEGGWRHGDLARERPPFFPRAVDERRIVRHKSFAPGASTVEEAIFDLQSMSYDFFLFVEAGSADDALVAQHEDGHFSVHFLDGGAATAVVPEGVTVDGHAAPQTDIETAEERLDAGHEPWVFFRDADTGRGHVLYRRYDGHYGLIVPLDEPD